ncbi:MAG: MBL fold metallo-hydrolase [Acidobacteria bacterium]|nr:MBL fold metallo-hydrolase [Acidobacteriota bacterium]
MFFHQFYLGCLAHASYMLGSGGTAAVVDPQRDVEIYLEEARRQGLRIAYVIETHLHADFVSGHRELATRTGAEIYVGRAAQAAFPHHAVEEGDELRFGSCALSFLETPGHTLESLCVLVTDLEKSAEPFAVLTGDTLFIGDVGRPDLSPSHTPQQLAALLYDSLHRKLLALPDSVLVYPAHGAGSLCGRNISAESSSTIGRQRATNYALRPMPKEDFVRILTAEFAARPGYFARDAEINRQGAAALAELPPLRAMSPGQVAECGNSVILLDTRPAALYGAGHVPGALNIGLGGQFASWAATVLGLDRPIILIAEDAERVAESRMRLARVGVEKVIGYLEGGVEAWRRAGQPWAAVPQISVEQLAAELHQHPGGMQVLDVRRAAEWNAGHIEGAVHRPLDTLCLEGDGEFLDRTRPVAVHCKGGYRSSIASGILKRAGFQDVSNVVGGFDAWQVAGLPKV